MTGPPRQVADALRCCGQNGIVPTRHLLVVQVATQKLTHLEVHPVRTTQFHSRSYRCSTSKFGIGSIANSNCTPLGLHRIARKIGGGWPVGAVFKGRRMIGYTWDGLPLASITDRIFWLEGLEPGRNRGGDVDSFARYIYIHGTGDEPTLGRPASHGCIHLAAADLIPLHDQLPEGTLVWIAER